MIGFEPTNRVVTGSKPAASPLRHIRVSGAPFELRPYLIGRGGRELQPLILRWCVVQESNLYAYSAEGFEPSGYTVSPTTHIHFLGCYKGYAPLSRGPQPRALLLDE